MDTEKFSKTIFLGLIANKILTKSEYRKLTARAIKGYQGNIPQYDEDKLYNVFINSKELKPYIDKYNEVNELVKANKFDDAIRIIEDKIKETK